MRRAVLYTMIATFLLLGVMDLREGKVRTGLAAVLLGVVQALFFV